MAHQKKDDSDLEKSKKRKSPDTDIFEIPKKKTKVPGKIKIIKTKEKDTKRGTTKETADIKREILEEEVLQDKKSPSLIEKLDYSKKCIEQLKSCERFKLVLTTTLFPKLFNNGVSKEELDKLANFSSPTLNEKIKNITEKLRGTEHEINGPERIAIKKLQEIATHSGSTLFSDLNKEWTKLIGENYAIYNQSIEAKKALSKPKEKKEEKEEENPITKFRKNNPTLSTVLLVAGAIAAGYGIYKYFTNKDGNKSKAIAGTAILGTIVLGGILGYPTISKWFKENIGSLDIFSKLKEIPEALESGLDWLNEKTGFTAMKERMANFYNDHKIKLPDWFDELDLSEMAKDLGITKENVKSWAEYAVAGGSVLLLYKWLGKKKFAKGLAFNAGLYLFMVREGPDSLVGKLLTKLTGQVDQAKNMLLTELKDIPGADLFINDALTFNLKNKTETLLEWMKEHPIESMAAMNGLWVCRGMIYAAIKASLKGVGKAGVYILKNPVKSVIAGATIYALYESRRKFSLTLIEKLYDDPNSKEAKEMLEDLDKLLNIDRSKPETFKEKLIPAYLKSIVEDPYNALQLQETIDAYNKGLFAFAVDAGGKMLLLAKGLSIPIQLWGLSWESFKSLSHIYSPENNDNILVPAIISGGLTYVFGSMAWQGFKAYPTVYSSGDTMGRGLWRCVKSLAPLTAEWKFVLKSSLTGFPGVRPILRKIHTRHIGKAQNKLDEILKLTKKKPVNYTKIVEITEELGDSLLFRDFEMIKENLRCTNQGYKTAKRISNAKKQFEDIRQAAIDEDLDKITRRTKYVRARLASIKDGTIGILTRINLIRQGKFKEAMALSESAEDLKKAAKEAAETAPPVRPINNKELFRHPDGKIRSKPVLKNKAINLKKEIEALQETDPLRKVKVRELSAIESYLDPKKANFKIDEAAFDKLDKATRAVEIERLAGQMEAAEKGIYARFNDEVSKIVADAKAKNLPLSDPSVTKKLNKIDEDILIPFIKQKQQNLKLLVTKYKKLPRKLRSPALIAQMRHAKENTLLSRFIRGAKGRGKMMALMAIGMFALDALIHRNDPERDLDQILDELGPEGAQLVLDCLPVAGTFSNYYSAFSGEELITDRDVSGAWDRASNAIWGTVGLAGDIVTVITAVPSGSGSIWANVALRLAKAAKGGSRIAPKIIKMWPRIQKIAERMGGFRKFAARIIKYLRSGKKGEKIVKGLRRIEKAGVIAGTALLAGGITYNLRYAFVDTETEIDFPPELMGRSPIPDQIDGKINKK